MPRACGGRIAEAYRNAQTKEELLRKHPIGGAIRSVKLYKNERFEIEFGNHEEAVRVAGEVVNRLLDSPN